MLECWYMKNYACVKWGDSFSPFVHLKTGTRHGGITSSYLFAIYADDVIIKLHKSSLGCHIYNMCFNVFMYADDIFLASVSVAELQQTINIVKNELKWLDMEINVKNIYENVIWRILGWGLGWQWTERIGDVASWGERLTCISTEIRVIRRVVVVSEVCFDSKELLKR